MASDKYFVYKYKIKKLNYIQLHCKKEEDEGTRNQMKIVSRTTTSNGVQLKIKFTVWPEYFYFSLKSIKALCYVYSHLRYSGLIITLSVTNKYIACKLLHNVCTGRMCEYLRGITMYNDESHVFVSLQNAGFIPFTCTDVIWIINCFSLIVNSDLQ